MTKFPPISVHNLGDYLREQRHSAELSLRQLSEVAGISNPYLSQIERGLKKPSAEILQALAKALRISAESLVGESAPRTASRARRSTKAAEPARPIRPTKPRPAKTPAHHSPDPAVNTTKEN